MWNICCARNKLVLRGHKPEMSATIAIIFSQLQVARQDFGHMTSHSFPYEISWQHLHVETMILNIYEYVLTNPEKAGFGDLIRNNEASFSLPSMIRCQYLM